MFCVHACKIRRYVYDILPYKLLHADLQWIINYRFKIKKIAISRGSHVLASRYMKITLQKSIFFEGLLPHNISGSYIMRRTLPVISHRRQVVIIDKKLESNQVECPR